MGLGLRWLAVLGCVLAFASGPLVFFNLYYVHDYYPCANTLFLVAAVGICLATMLEMGSVAKRVGIALTLLMVVDSLRVYSGFYYSQQVNNVDTTIPMCKEIQKNTSPDDVIVNIGHEWDSSLPYYAERRTIACLGYVLRSVDGTLDEMFYKIANLKSEKVTGLIIDRTPGRQVEPDSKKILGLLASNGIESNLVSSKGYLDFYKLARKPADQTAAKAVGHDNR